MSSAESNSNYFTVVTIFSTSLRYGASAINSGDSSAFTVGSKSTQSSSGGFLMRSLAVWRRALSSQEVSSVYLAGKDIFWECSHKSNNEYFNKFSVRLLDPGYLEQNVSIKNFIESKG